MSDTSWLREKFARAGRLVSVGRVRSGSPGVYDLRLAGDLRDVRSIPAITALVRRGASVTVAKPAIEAVMDEGRAEIALPTVEDEATLIADLAREGVAVSAIRSAAATKQGAAAPA